MSIDPVKSHLQWSADLVADQRAVSREWARVARKAAQLGISVAEYDQLVASGQIDVLITRASRRKRSERQKRIKLGKIAYTCPVCGIRKEDLADWPQHAEICRKCSRAQQLMHIKEANRNRARARKEAAPTKAGRCAICDTSRRKITFHRGIWLCRLCREKTGQ